MIRSALAILTASAIFLAAGLASANPPNAIHARYDEGRGELDVVIEHPVVNKWKHFIREVTIYKNGAKAWSQEFDFQTSFRNQTFPPVKIAAVDGDALRIVAVCNVGGEGEETVTVGASEKAKPAGPIEHDIEK